MLLQLLQASPPKQGARRPGIRTAPIGNRLPHSTAVVRTKEPQGDVR